MGSFAALQQANQVRNSTVGTPWYAAPEVVEGEAYSMQADIWSIGCSVIELVSGKPPYSDLNSVAALFRMVEEPHPPIPAVLSKQCAAFVMRTFERDWRQRPLASEMLRDPWLAIGYPASPELHNELVLLARKFHLALD